MGIFNRNKKIEQRGIEYTDPIWGTISLINSGSYSANLAMKLSSVYRAVNLIADSVAVLPVDVFVYRDNWKYRQYNTLYTLLNIAPNPYMSSFTMKRMIIQYVILQGNAYVLLVRDNSGEIIQMQLLDSHKMQVQIVNGDIVYLYSNKIKYTKEDIVHILNYSNDGITGLSTLSYASTSLDTAYNAETHAGNFFKTGSLSGILRPIAGVTINSNIAKKAKDAFINSLDSAVGGTSGGVVVLDAGLEYQPIQISPKEAQLLESRAFGLTEIARFFGVSPTLLFDYAQGTSYATVEQTNLAFLSQTLQPILEKIEAEFYRKIFTPVEYNSTDLKFDVSALLRMDGVASASYYSQLFNMGGMTVNELREKTNAPFPVVGGNECMIGVQVQPLKNIIAKPPVPPTPLDNNLKQTPEDDGTE